MLELVGTGEFKNRVTELNRMKEMVEEAIQILQAGRRPIEDFGRLLHESWRYKRILSARVSTPEIDTMYEAAMSAGAIGGKILGAGGGGFLLLFVPPERQASVRERLKRLIHVPFRFEDAGSRLVMYSPNGWS
jgi:D-glycero-alpha-D-manno-heptose-7-phosphate kinase